MVVRINHNRQLVLWGKAGQELLKESSLLITGAGLLGREIAKSAAILGVGHIYMMDNYRAHSEQPFLDIPLKQGHSVVRQLAKLIPEKLNSDCVITPINDATRQFQLDCCDPDFIIDTTNKVQSQVLCKAYAEQHNIPLVNIAVNQIGGYLTSYNPAESYEGDKLIDGLEGQVQGIIPSNIFAGIAMDEFRKSLFKRNRDKFKKTKILQRDNTEKPYLEILDREPLLVDNVKYTIIGETRTIDPRTVDDYITDSEFRSKDVLVLGGGSIGNYVIDMLARYGLRKLDVVDFDTYESHNLNRQPLAYDKVTQKKAQVLSERIKTISSERTLSRGIFGKITESITSTEEAKGIKLLNQNWFKQNRYDLIIGCFDNTAVRLLMNEYAVKQGFTYLDGGSSREGGTAAVYSPGVTNCLQCSLGLDLTELAENETRETTIRSGARNTDGCTFIEGSINMDNQIVAGLLVGEARRILAGEGNLVDEIMYKSNRMQRLQVSHNALDCRCGQ